MSTNVELNFEMRLPEWQGRFKRPTARLLHALYGHPQASAYRDLHLRQILINELGCIPADGHPSVFFHETWHILVAVYVDDILASGSPAAQDEICGI